MRTLKLTLAYDGTAYAGWQVQRGKTTIQGAVEAALHRITGERVRVTGSGRTDAGVHALAQVAHAKVRSRMDRAKLQFALNAVLPSDIVVTRVEDALSTFHAQYGAKSKRYRYRIAVSTVLPFDRRYVHQVRVPLNAGLMRKEARVLLGRHDMRAFHKMSRVVKDARRTVSHVSLTREGGELVFEIEAGGFLHGMVRTIVGTLIDVGRGHRPPGTMAAILKARKRVLAGPSAPARGLILLSVRYK